MRPIAETFWAAGPLSSSHAVTPHADVSPEKSISRINRSDSTKFARALEVISQFKRELLVADTDKTVMALAVSSVMTLRTIQGQPQDLEHFVKSLCQIAAAVRRRGWPGLGAQVLES